MGKNKQRKSGKDKITGLSVTFSDIGTIKSDVVYGTDSEVGRHSIESYNSYMQGMRKAVDVRVEFEFNDTYMVRTMWIKNEQPDNQGRTEGLTRTFESGRFSYENGRLKKAVVQSMGQNWPDGDGPGGIIYTHPGQGITINNPKSFTSYGLALSPLATVANKTHGYLDFGMDGSNDDEIVGLGESGVRSFGGGKIFYKGWEANPLASNLI